MCLLALSIVQHAAGLATLGCAVLCNAQVWIVLELCNGGTLKDAVSSGRLKVDSKMELVRDFLKALLTTVWGPLPLLNVPQLAVCVLHGSSGQDGCPCAVVTRYGVQVSSRHDQ